MSCYVTGPVFVLMAFMDWGAGADRVVVLLGIPVFCGIIIIAICALIQGSRSLALTSLVLAVLPAFVFALSRGLFWETYSDIWFVGLPLSVAAMIEAYWARGETPPGKPPGVFMLISVLVGFAMIPFLCCGFSALNHMPVDLSLEREIKPGMTKAEVEAVLGPPSQRRRSGISEVWGYYVRRNWGVTFRISFDEQGTVYDARRDGW